MVILIQHPRTGQRYEVTERRGEIVCSPDDPRELLKRDVSPVTRKDAYRRDECVFMVNMYYHRSP